jgi:hypothetical protein
VNATTTDGGRQVAGRMARAWAIAVIGVGLALAVLLPPATQASQSGYCENIDHPGPCSPMWPYVIPGTVVAAVGGCCLAASVAFRRGRPWGRWAVVATSGLWACFAAAGAIANAFPPVEVLGLIGWLTFLSYHGTVAVLAARPAPAP